MFLSFPLNMAIMGTILPYYSLNCGKNKNFFEK